MIGRGGNTGEAMSEKGGYNMAAVTDERKSLNRQKQEVDEILKLLEQMTQEEKRELKGIMIGIQMSKESGVVKTA